MAKDKSITEFGDFQTPIDLAIEVCKTVHHNNIHPQTIIEPTCGKGAFVKAANMQFPNAKSILGFDINPDYIAEAKSQLPASRIKLKVDDFFNVDWQSFLNQYKQPILILGNPPWVTNSELGSLNSDNLPEKSNFKQHSGLDAITGKSNFDISEWMLTKLLDWLNGKEATIAVLCKCSVARKTLMHSWSENLSIEYSKIYNIDARMHFNAAVDACLLICKLKPEHHSKECTVHQSLDVSSQSSTFGYINNRLISNIDEYQNTKLLEGNCSYKWRSGVKHDCSKVMEFNKVGSNYINGLGQSVSIEQDYLFPMLKSSDLANGKVSNPCKWMLVTQHNVGDDTSHIKSYAPKTWSYLESHAEYLDNRKSSIYKNKPRFSVFGIGDYTFSNWKVAISGFYKHLNFSKIGTFRNKPIILDDTSYFIPCTSEHEADLLSKLLNSKLAKQFLSSFIFWDAKRPITTSLLSKLDLYKLACHSNMESKYKQYCRFDSDLLFS